MLLLNLLNSSNKFACCRKLLKLITGLCLLLLAACSSNDPYLYDRTGFDEGARPVVAPNPKAASATPPEYYYRQQQQTYPSYSAQQPVYAAPQVPYQQNYPVQQQYPQGGGSRYYTNPYAIPPSPNYYQRLDVDQYYIPPNTYYNNTEQPKSMGAQGNLNY